MFISVLSFVIIMLAMVIPGYVLRKVNLIKEASVGSFVSVLLYVCSPLLIFRSLFYDKTTISNPTDPQLLWGILITFIVAFIAIVIIFFVAKIAFIKMKDKPAANAYIFAAVFGNIGFIGIPFLQYILQGDTMLPYALLYGAVFNVVFNILCWTLGVYIITGSFRDMRPLKIIFNPIVIVSLIAFPLFFMRVDLTKHVKPLADVISFLGGMTTPLSMIIVGIRLADVKVKQIFIEGWAYLSSFVRLVIAPVAAFGLVMLLREVGLFDAISPSFYNTYGRAICAVTIIFAALPAAVSTIAFCERNNGDSKAAVRAFMNCTLLSLITMPLLIPVLFGKL